MDVQLRSGELEGKIIMTLKELNSPSNMLGPISAGSTLRKEVAREHWTMLRRRFGIEEDPEDDYWYGYG